MGGVLLNSKDIPILRDIVGAYKRRRKNNPQTNRKRYQGAPGSVIKRGIITEIGDYDVHIVSLISGTFSDSLTEDSLEHNNLEAEAYVAEEFEQQPYNIGDIVVLAKINGKYWIVQKKDGCEGYCIHEDFDGDGYIYGWSFRAPNLPCCPEAGGVHILTTSDSGVTYETSVFECNEDGTERKWVYNTAKKSLRITPSLDEGNLEYRTDSTPAACTVQLQRYEHQRFPDRDLCGKIPKSVCLNPLCGVGTCSYCSNGISPMSYTIVIGGGGTPNPARVSNPYADQCDCSETYEAFRVIASKNADHCTWGRVDGGGAGTAGVQLNGDKFTVSQGSLVSWSVDVPTDCTEELTLTLDDYSEETPYCIGHPETIKIIPNNDAHLESNCYPETAWSVLSFSSQVCRPIPYFLEFELSGITDGTCNECTTLNDIQRIAVRGNTTSAFWQSLSSLGTCLGAYTGTPHFQVQTNYSSGQTRLVLGAPNGISNQSVFYDGPAAADWNCDGPNEFTFDSATGECDNWPATITVYPLVDE